MYKHTHTHTHIYIYIYIQTYVKQGYVKPKVGGFK